MNAETKDMIRRRISAAVGHDVGEVYPEFFLSETRGRMEVMRYADEANNVVRLQISFVAGRLAHFTPTVTLN